MFSISATPFRIERHALGPRVHIFGQRFHEWQAGVAILLGGVAAGALGVDVIPTVSSLAVGAWLVLKDWRDVLPATRDTASWRLGIHLPPRMPSVALRERVPIVAAIATALVAVVNLASAVLPAVPARVRTLLSLAPAAEVRIAHVLAVPVGLALLGVAHQLAQRRRWAAKVALGLLVLAGTLDVLKGLDIEEAALSWALATLLWVTRDAFWVVHGRGARAAVAHAGSTPDQRSRVAAIVRRYGDDTLSAFKLRQDLARRWSADGRAMAGYRVQAGAMLVAGDPVGPAETTRDLLGELRDHARAHGLALGVIGASERVATEAQTLGLRQMYLGDEAILSTGDMDLSGGARKSLRKAVNRVARHGYVTELATVADIDTATLRRLDTISDRWRDGADERGFSMAHDAISDTLLPDAVVVLARDADSLVRGFLHFVPVFGRPVMSVGFMRRDPDTPNGLMDFLIVEAARLLRDQGCEEFSLNFCAYGRWLREPRGVERLVARLIRVGDRWFQIQRLLTFNSKFDPRWQPRYLLFDGLTRFPRVALAAMLAEGQIPSLPTSRVRRSTIAAPA